MSQQFPRTTVGGVSLPRMIIGTNWLMGYSHTGHAADVQINERHSDPQRICDVLCAFMEYGVDAFMGCFDVPRLQEGIRRAEDKCGKKLILIDTPGLNVSDSAEGRHAAEEKIKEAKRNGATFCFPHHTSVEQLMNKHLQKMPRLEDYLYMIREQGMLPGLSAHMPECVLYADKNDYDVETYIQIYNCLGFLMQVEIEFINKVIRNAKKPVMTIKSMAAGRCTPFVGLNFSWGTLRDCDMVTVGCTHPAEVHECIEISLAHFEKRLPNLEGRSSPAPTSINS